MEKPKIILVRNPVEQARRNPRRRDPEKGRLEYMMKLEREHPERLFIIWIEVTDPNMPGEIGEPIAATVQARSGAEAHDTATKLIEDAGIREWTVAYVFDPKVMFSLEDQIRGYAEGDF